MINGKRVKDGSSSLVKFYWNITKNKILISDIPIKDKEESGRILNLLSEKNLKKIKNIKKDERCILEDTFKAFTLDLNYKVDIVKVVEKEDEVIKGYIELKKINYIQTNVDKVTGFRKKEELIDIINEKLKDSKEKAAFILIDLDNFKFINESFGYEIGDTILNRVGNRLVKALGSSEYVCRYNGDEFIVFLSDIKTEESLEKILNKIMKIFYNSIKIKRQEIYVNASIGVSIYPQNGLDFYTLLKNSDAALSRAKVNGKGNYVFFDNTISKEFSRSYNIQRCLRDAIKKEELYVLFQPKVLLEDTKVYGFEALIRWQSKELGFVSPGEMIPIAEVSRQILPISTFVLEEVFKKIRNLLNRGFNNFKIAVNLSELQLRYNKILPDLKRLKRKYNVDLKYIEIEITESILMKSFEKNIETLKAIKKMGATIALDDFGTGYSSLNYLTKLPIDVLKIDRSFIIDLIGNLKNRCIVENIINLSHELGMEVVAEGVEEKNQVEYLKSIECDTIQGYYYSKPKPFNEIVEMVENKINL